MAMIPYEELVASLQQWRIRQGLSTGPSDYLGMRTFDIGVAPETAAAAASYGVGDSTSEVDAGDLEVLDEELADAVAVDAYSASDEGYADYGQQAEYGGALDEQPAYEEAPAAYDEQPAYEEAPAAFDEQPAYEAAPAAFDEQPAYEEAPAAFDEQAYDAQPAYEEAPAAFDEQPAYDAGYGDEAAGYGGEEEEATVIASQPSDDGLGGDIDFSDTPYGDAGQEPPPLEAAPFDDDIEVSDGALDDEATRVGGESDLAAPPPLAPAPDDELP